MNKLFFYSLSAVAVLGLSGCNSHKNDMPKHDHSHNHIEDGHNHDHDQDRNVGKHDSNEITLHAHDAEELGVKTTVVELQPFREVVKVTGVCESSPTDNKVATAQSGGIVKLSSGMKPGKRVAKGDVIAIVSAAGMAGGDPNANARIAVEAAKRELDRIEPLHSDGIVSTRDYNAVKAEYEKALAAAGGASSGSRVVAPISGVITDIVVADGAYVEQGTGIANVVSNDNLIVRADVPVRYASVVGDISDCNFEFAGMDSVYSLGALNGRTVSTTSGGVVNGYIPVYFDLKNDGKLLNGMPVEVYLKGRLRDDVISVPLKAVVEQQGVNFVYERLDDDCYRKLPVKLGNNDGIDVEIVSGLTPGRDIVTSGALFVKLAESSGAVPEGHSHSH